MGFVESSCIFVLCVLCNRRARICSEFCVRVWSAPGAGTGRGTVFLVCAGLTGVVKLDENSLVTIVDITK